MNPSAGLVTVLQLAATAARLCAFVYIVFELEESGASSSTLVTIGYIPFLAFLDIGLQGYARAIYLQAGTTVDQQGAFRRLYAVTSLGLLCIGVVLGELTPVIGFPLLLVAAYVSGSVVQLWERWLALSSRPLICALVEIGLLAASCLAFLVWGGIDLVLLAGLASMPLARLATHAGSGTGYPVTVSPSRRSAEWRAYVAFSLAQQFAGSLAAALPSVYGQLSGDYSTLARNLVIFRLVHSGGALASTAVNAIASRIFFDMAGERFAAAERTYVKYGGAIGTFGAVIALTTAGVSKAAFGGSLLLIVGIAFLLILVNLQSSLLMNRGMPSRALYCQLLVLVMSVWMLGELERYARISGVLMLGVVVSFLIIHRSNIRAYRQCLNPSPL